MSYAVGIDLGTTFTAAAVCDPGVAPQMLSLGSSGYSVPSVLFLREDGSFLAGEAAELRSAGDPTRVARHFKRRLGDEVPVRLAGTAFDPLALTRELLDWVLELVTSRRGEAPAVVVLTHPANWGDYRAELLRDAAVGENRQTLLISEPAAAAAHYVQGERVEPGELIGVYDLGGGTFDAVVMRRTEDGFETAGRAGGVERLGGVDFDDVIWSYVLDEAEVDTGADDDATLAAAYDLRSNCVAAKRLLSVDTAADIRVPLPAATSSVRLTRAEFERRIRPRLAETVEAFDDVLSNASLAASDLSRILLVGGSSRIPLVGEMLASHFGVRIAVDSDPKNAVALGAAGFGANTLAPVSVASSFRSQTRAVSATPEARRTMPPSPTPPSPTLPPPTPGTVAPGTTPPAVHGTPAPTPVAPAPAAPTPTAPAPAAPAPATPAPAQRLVPPTSPEPASALSPTAPQAPIGPPPTSPLAPPPSSSPPSPPSPARTTAPSAAPPEPDQTAAPGHSPGGTPTPNAPLRPEAAPFAAEAPGASSAVPATPSTDSFAPPPLPSTRSAASQFGTESTGDALGGLASGGATPAEPASELSGVSTESGHRVRTAVDYDMPTVAEFETVPAQAEAVGQSRVVLVVAVVAVVALIVGIVAVVLQ